MPSKQNLPSFNKNTAPISSKCNGVSKLAYTAKEPIKEAEIKVTGLLFLRKVQYPAQRHRGS
jgi:hypothetical protein